MQTGLAQGNADITNLRPLRDCPLEIINIRNTGIKDFSEFLYYKELKKVICTAKQQPLLLKAGVGKDQIEVRP